MPTLSRLFLLFSLILTPALAQSGSKKSAASGPKKIGEVNVLVDNAITVRITSSSPELQTLARQAFSAHGRYNVVSSGGANYDLKFTPLGSTQVRVDITRGSAGTPVASEVANGTSARNALLRAADLAVARTNGLNPSLRGFFTARLAFVMQRGGKGDIYTSDLFFGEGRRLTQDNALTLSPRWSPDGSRIVYTSYFRKGAPDIYLLDPTTGRRDEFASFRGTNMGGRFSPNGSQIAMVLTGEGASEIYVAGAQGRASPVRKTRSEAVKSSPCWSPDGSQILFAMDPGPQLYTMPAAGGAPRRLNVGFSYATEPDWSRANPNKIACTVRMPGGRFQIAVLDQSTGKATVVSKADFDAVEPSWLADGRHLVYTARDRSTSVLCILDTETGNSARISPPESMAMQAGVWIAP